MMKFAAYLMEMIGYMMKMLDNLNKFYNNNNAIVTYGGMYKYANDILDKKYISMQYPKNVITDKSYRKSQWCCYHFLRTGYAKLFKLVPETYQKDHNNEWLKCSTDAAIMYPVLEMANNKHFAVDFPTYVYNTDNTNIYSSSYYKQNNAWRKYRLDVSKHIQTLNYTILYNKYINSLKYKKRMC